jgi:hypothetical protein
VTWILHKGTCSFLGLHCAALATVVKELGLCLIRRHLQDFDPPGILGESQIVLLRTRQSQKSNFE